MTEAGELGRRIASLIDARGLNPALVSKRMGRSHDYVRTIITGRTRSPSAANLALLAEAIGVSVAELTGSDASEPTQASTGFAEDLVPFDPEDQRGKDLAQLMAPESTHPILMRLKRDFPGFSMLSGDVIAYDANKSPMRGQLVVVNFSDDTGIAHTSIRRLLDPFLITEDPSLRSEPEIANDGNNAVMGPVVFSFRSQDSVL